MSGHRNTNVTSNSNFAVLKLVVNPNNPDLVKLYQQHVGAHNAALKKDPFPNSGFDIFVPSDTVFSTEIATYMIDMEIKTEMVFYEAATNTIQTCAYTVFPRSSMSKTPLMLANHTGIIDAGYRGSLMGAFRCLKIPEGQTSYTVDKHTRLLQICHPSLCPVHVELVPENMLSTTSRGAGGFGSTGIVGVGLDAV
jgi:dUTPase